MDRYYIGHTGMSVEDRLRRHLSAHKGFTSRAKDWQLVYQEIYPTKSAASQRELTLKNWKSRTLLEALISGS